MKLLTIIARLIIGSVFIFSGFVKAVDPLGSAYKFHDYFEAFNLGMLDWLSLPLAVLLCTLEFIAGVSVLSGIRQKAGIWLVILLMIIFTPLTFVLALTNPVTDCGCFGDAVHLSNWQTFGKNIVILALAIVLFLKRNTIKEYLGPVKGYSVIAASAGFLILFSLYNLRYLPVIDFLPYNKGTVIAEKMTVPEGAPVDEYLTTFIYEKNGTQQEFTLENYPANDSTWTFINQKSVLIKKGYRPPVHDFAISDSTGTDITSKILDRKGYTLLMISKKLEEANQERLEAGFETGNSLMKSGADFYVLTSSGSDRISLYNCGIRFCTTDETTLKTVVRANPGYILLRDGKITGKWSWANLPDKETLSEVVQKYPL